MQIHVITFDIPFPADYGGVIDVFYKLKSLYRLGFRITLHCFQYANRQPTAELEQYCEKVFYYPRPLTVIDFCRKTPFIVASRSSKQLLVNLQKGDAPVLFEGFHTTYWIEHQSLAHRKKIIRVHNIESQYYANLAKLEKQFWKKIFFQIESWKLKVFEQKILQNTNLKFLTISEKDTSYLKEKGINNVVFCPAFHHFDQIEPYEGHGNYILFHGNLSIADNEQAAMYLIEKVFAHIEFPCIIAGKNPTQKLEKTISQYPHIQLIANPNEQKNKNLLQNAHIHILWSFQNEGMKLKFYYALAQGRYILANENVIQDASIEQSGIYIVKDTTTLKAKIKELLPQKFDNQYIKSRNEYLLNQINTQKEALKTFF
jgi:hypothetical protein